MTTPTIDVQALINQIIPLISAFISIFMAVYMIKAFVGVFKEIGGVV
jgi:hypothetical protein